jgi:Tol biopolymer transport system component
VSSSGTLAYIAEDDLNAPRQLMWVKADGSAAPVGIAPRRFTQPALSPDGGTIAAVVNDGETDIWLGDVRRGVVRRFTDAQGTQTSPVWTPDGRWLLYASEEPAFHVYRQSTSAADPPERLVDGPSDAVPSSVLPSGEGVLYTLSDPVTRNDLWLLPLTGDRKARAIVKTRFDEADAHVSPNGRWLAYVSNESGRTEVYVQTFPDGGDRTQVSIDGGDQPRWSADGRELFFRSSERLIQVSVGAAPPLTVSRPTELFRMSFAPGYSVARDGRFVVAQRDPLAPPVRVNIILNWFAQLRARVPVP